MVTVTKICLNWLKCLMVFNKGIWKMFRLIILFFLFLHSSLSLSSDIVLLPVEIESYQSSETNHDEIIKALKQGLLSKFDKVYYGKKVEDKLAQEYAKESCSPELCSENTAINFGTNYLAETAILIKERAYSMLMNVFDVTNSNNDKKYIITCIPCNQQDFINKLLKAKY